MLQYFHYTFATCFHISTSEKQPCESTNVLVIAESFHFHFFNHNILVLNIFRDNGNISIAN